MPRIPELDEDQFDGRQRSIYAEILASRGHLGGPFKIWLYSPELADRAQRLGQFLRYDTNLEPRLSVILAGTGGVMKQVPCVVMPHSTSS